MSIELVIIFEDVGQSLLDKSYFFDFDLELCGILKLSITIGSINVLFWDFFKQDQKVKVKILVYHLISLIFKSTLYIFNYVYSRKYLSRIYTFYHWSR